MTRSLLLATLVEEVKKSHRTFFFSLWESTYLMLGHISLLRLHGGGSRDFPSPHDGIQIWNSRFHCN